MTKKGPTPSLLSGSNGKPSEKIGQKVTNCSRCKISMPKGEKYFVIPKTGGGFTTKKPFCLGCFKDVLKQSRLDLEKVESMVDNY